MGRRPLGIPLVVWGVLGAAIAAVWAFVWPSDVAAGADGVRFFVLRWFHAIVWLLLALSAFAAVAPRGERVARALGWSALATYVVFITVLLQAE